MCPLASLQKKKRAPLPQSGEAPNWEEREKGWVRSRVTHLALAAWTWVFVRVNNAVLRAQGVHYTRRTRCIAACNEEGQEDFRVPQFFVGDSLAFDFGEVRTVRDFFGSLGGVKVPRLAAMMHPTMHPCR